MSRGNIAGANAYSVNNTVLLVRGGAAYFNKLEEIIDNAQQTIHLQTYIFDPDETGKRIVDALINASKRKVHVYLMIDGFASQKLTLGIANRLKRAGVHFCFFEPFFRSRHFYIGRRLHYKVIVADGCKCMVGGVNISNRYNDTIYGAAWLDWAIYSEGQAAADLHAYCVKMWNTESPENKCEMPSVSLQIVTPQECMVRVRKNDWINRHTDVTKSYREMFARADSDILIMTSYFWPARKLLKQIATASKRGVKIRLVLAGVSDIKIAKYAERYMYRWLFRNNIELYEYQENILHAKLAMYDDEWVTIGSYNVNNISAYASVEVNLDVKDRTFVGIAKQKVESIIKDSCTRITPETYISSNNILHRMFQAISYGIIHLAFIVFTFYFKQNTYRG